MLVEFKEPDGNTRTKFRTLLELYKFKAKLVAERCELLIEAMKNNSPDEQIHLGILNNELGPQFNKLTWIIQSAIKSHNARGESLGLTPADIQEAQLVLDETIDILKSSGATVKINFDS